MAAQQFEIQVQDKVDSSIETKIAKIGTSARTSYTALQLLQQQLNTLQGTGLANLVNELNRVNQATRQLNQLQQQQTQTAGQAALAAQRLATALAQTQTAQQRLATETQRTAAAQAAAQQRLVTESQRTAQAQQRLILIQQQLRTEQERTAAAQERARLAQLRLNQAQDSGTSSAGGFGSAMGGMLTKLAAAVGLAVLAKQIIEVSEAYTVLQNKLQNVSTSQEQVNQLTGRLFDLANETRTGVDATATAFTRFDRSLKSMGKSQDDTLRMTETINKALTNSGATATEASSALLQLSQAFNSGKLQGDEFRSVSENMPVVLDAVAQAMGKPINEVKKLGTQGKITSQVLFDAFKLIESSVDATFAKTTPTISQALTVLKNNAIQFFGEINTASGGTKSLAQDILDLAKYIGELRKELMSSISPFMDLVNTAGELLSLIGTYGAGLVKAFAEQITSMDSSLTGASTGAQALELGLKAFIVVLQAVSVLAANVIFVLGRLADTAVTAARTVAAVASLDFKMVGTLDIQYKNNSEKARADLDDFEKRVLALSTAQKELPKASQADVRKVDNSSSALRGAGVNTLSADVDTKAAKAAENRAKALAKVNAQLDTQTSNLYTLAPARAVDQEFDNLTIALAQKKITLTDTEAASIKSKMKALAEGKIVQQQFDALYAAAIGPQQQYVAGLQAAKLLMAQGAISTAQGSAMMDKIIYSYRAATEPLFTFNEGIEDQLQILGKLGPQQEIERQILQKQNELRDKNQVLSKEDNATMREKLALVQTATAVNGVLNKIYEETAGKQTELANTQTAYNQALATGKINAEQHGIAMQKLAVDTANLKMQMGDATFADALNAGMGSFVSSYQGVMTGLSSAWGDFFTTFNNGFADSIGKAITQGGSLSDMLNNVAQQVTGNLISALIKLGMQYVVNAALGSTLTATSLATSTGLSVAAAGVTAAAWAPAAAMVSLASFGANSAAAMAGLAATSALSSALAVAGGLGFQDGGFTGNVGTSEVAGVVHGQEFVVNAAATAKNRSVLEAMNAGSSVSAAASNNGSGTATGQTVVLVTFDIDNNIQVSGGSDSNANALEKAATAISQKTQADVMDSIRSGGTWSKIIKNTANS